jgi:hypothetical protein
MRRIFFKRFYVPYCLIFSILLIMTAGAALPDEDPTWKIETVDDNEARPWSISIDLDPADKPHICYASRKSSFGNLVYAKRVGSGWDARMIDNPGDVMNASLALDSAGNPHIGYYDGYTHQQLRYMRWDGSTWNKQIVEKTGAWANSISMAVDSSGNPHISFLDTNDKNLKYAKFGSGWDWEFHTVDSENNVGTHNSMALDSSGNPHIVYFNQESSELKYARWDGSTWQIKIVDNIGLYEDHTSFGYLVPSASIAIDSSGYPHISYCSGSPQTNLKYAKWNGNQKGWSILTIDNVGNVGRCNAIAVDLFDRPHIAYYDDTKGDLKYARWDDSVWKIHIIKKVAEEETAHTAYKISIAADSSGNPHIAYSNSRTNSLEYAQGNIPKPETAKMAAAQAEDVTDKSKISPKTPPSKLIEAPKPVKPVQSGTSVAASAQGWQKIWGPVGSVYLGYDPAKKMTVVYATNRSTKDIYKYTGKWEKVGGPGAMFAADHSGHLYGLSTDKSTVVEYVETSKKWQRIGGAAEQIYAGGNKLYATNPNTGEIYAYSRETKKWTKAGGTAAMFAVDSTGQLFSLSSDKSAVFKFDEKQMTWTKVGGGATHIYAGGNKLFAISPAGGDIYGYTSETGKWSKAGGPGKMFAVGFLGQLHGISSDGSAIFSRSDTTAKWTEVGARSAGIFAGGNTLYSIDPMTHELYMLKSGGQDATPIHLPAIKDD